MGNNQTRPAACAAVPDGYCLSASIDGSREYAYFIGNHTENRTAIYALSGILGEPPTEQTIVSVVNQMKNYSIKYCYLPHVVRAIEKHRSSARAFFGENSTEIVSCCGLITDPMEYFACVVQQVSSNPLIHERFWTSYDAFTGLFENTILDYTDMHVVVDSNVVNIIALQIVQARTFNGCVHINNNPTKIQKSLCGKNMAYQYTQRDLTNPDLQISWCLAMLNMFYSMFNTPNMVDELKAYVYQALISLDCQMVVFRALLKCARDEIVTPCDGRIKLLLQIISCTNLYFTTHPVLWSINAPALICEPLVVCMNDIMTAMDRRAQSLAPHNDSCEIILIDILLTMCRKFPIQAAIEPISLHFETIAAPYRRIIMPPSFNVSDTVPEVEFPSFSSVNAAVAATPKRRNPSVRKPVVKRPTLSRENITVVDLPPFKVSDYRVKESRAFGGNIQIRKTTAPSRRTLRAATSSDDDISSSSDEEVTKGRRVLSATSSIENLSSSSDEDVALATGNIAIGGTSSPEE